MSVLFTNEMAQKILDAINTLNSNLVNARGGALSTLSTTTKSSIIAAINELVTGQGSLSSLSTSVKTSLVAAVNELLNQRGGALSNLSTNSKISIIAAINELVTGQGTLSSLSTSAKNNLVAAVNELVNADATINSKLSRIYNNNAVARNATPRGKYLGNTITAAQYAAIANSTWDDLYLADYWILPINGKSVRATIAGFCCGYFEKPHIVLLLDNLGNFPINDTATCEGHLANSKLQTEIIPSLLEKIYPVIPEEHIMTLQEYVADAINSAGQITHYTEMQLKLFLPSRNNFGGLAWHPYTSTALRTKDYRLNTAYVWVSSIRWPLTLYAKKSDIFYYCWLAENQDATEWTYGSDDGFVGNYRPANSLKGNYDRDLKFSPYMFLV